MSKFIKIVDCDNEFMFVNLHFVKAVLPLEGKTVIYFSEKMPSIGADYLYVERPYDEVMAAITSSECVPTLACKN